MIKEELDQYIKSLSDVPKQKSSDWYQLRKTTIGGSEVSIVIGINPFSNIRNLIAQKIGLTQFNGNPSTRWGILFEFITKKCVELFLHLPINIKELGSIDGVIQGQRYSPDGLGIVKLQNYKNQPEYYIILFEFKAPLRMIPKGKIPEHYAAQVQTGLLTIPIADYAIFINNSYRKCALEDIGFNSRYDEIYHASDFKKYKKGLTTHIPYACGIICFYQTQPQYDNFLQYLQNNDNLEQEDQLYNQVQYKMIDRQLLLNENYLIDLGKANHLLFNRLLELYDQHVIKAIYYPIILNHSEINNIPFIQTHKLTHTTHKTMSSDDIMKYTNKCIKTFKNKCLKKQYIGIGYLPWKLMISDIILEEHNPEWYNIICDPIQDTIKTLYSIQNSNDPIQEYNKHFPSDLTSTESWQVSNINLSMDLNGFMNQSSTD